MRVYRFAISHIRQENPWQVPLWRQAQICWQYLPFRSPVSYCFWGPCVITWLSWVLTGGAVGAHVPCESPGVSSI